MQLIHNPTSNDEAVERYMKEESSAFFSPLAGKIIRSESKMLKLDKITLFLIFFSFSSSDAGSPCPSLEKIKPCFCTSLPGGETLLVCSGIKNRSQMEKVMKPLKSMILDRFLLLNVFVEEDSANQSNSIAQPQTAKISNEIFPTKWLSEVRVRELEIQNGHLSGCFLCDSALEGQADFMTSLVVKHANLRTHLCSTCSLGSSPTSVSTKELKRTPLLQQVDLSFNNIEVIDGYAFPPTLINLTKIKFTNNQIIRIHDNAFANLHQLKELDLSRNRLSTLSRKIFRSSDLMLRSIDLSYNSIQTLPEDMFLSLNGLREVDLSHNLIEILPSNTWTRLPSLTEKIDLRGNFLICNCTMNWISRRLSKSTKLMAHCAGPTDVEFQEIKAILLTLTNC